MSKITKANAQSQTIKLTDSVKTSDNAYQKEQESVWEEWIKGFFLLVVVRWFQNFGGRWGDFMQKAISLKFIILQQKHKQM